MHYLSLHVDQSGDLNIHDPPVARHARDYVLCSLPTELLAVRGKHLWPFN
jgi:hypothetical protein